MTSPTRNHSKRARIAELQRAGLTLADIGRLLGLSRQRVHQLAREDPETGRMYRHDAMKEWKQKARERA